MPFEVKDVKCNHGNRCDRDKDGDKHVQSSKEVSDSEHTAVKDVLVDNHDHAFENVPILTKIKIK